MTSCADLERIIKMHGFKVKSTQPTINGCIIDFYHPKIEIKPPVSYFLSSVVYDQNRNMLETTIRSKVDRFKELYLDYCCESENGECLQMCRPHFHAEEKIVSVEATFYKNPIKKFDRLLEEMK